MFPRNDAVRNTPFDLILGTDRLLHARCVGGGGGRGRRVWVSGGYNFIRGLILGGQFWNAQNVKGVEIWNMAVRISFILLLIKWSEMDLIQFSYVIVMYFKGGGVAG